MAVSADLWLFGKPGQEIEENEPVTPAEVRALGDKLKAHLDVCADIIEKMLADGWEAQMALFSVQLDHPEIETEEQARSHLKRIGVDDRALTLWELEDEEDIEAHADFSAN